MPSASTIRMQVETALARKIPSALTPQPKMVRPVVETGIKPLDELLHGGLPVGAVSELTGRECSGRTSAALSFLARITEANKVCAWVDVSNTFDPASAAAVGVDLNKLLWVRCGVPQTITERAGRRFLLPEKYLAPPSIKKGLHGGGFGPHPRTEVRGLSDAVGDLFAPRCAEPQHRPRPHKESAEPNSTVVTQAVRSPKQPGNTTPSNRACGVPICCYRPVASVPLCSTWEVLRRSMLPASSFRPGTGTDWLRSAPSRAFSSSRNTRARKAVQNCNCVYFPQRKATKRQPSSPGCSCESKW